VRDGVRTNGTDVEQVSPPGISAYGGTPSPDLTRIAYIRVQPDSARLVVRDLVTGHERVIARVLAAGFGRLSAPRWSPTTDWIAYTSRTQNFANLISPGSVFTKFAYQLRVVKADGSENRNLLPPGSAGGGHLFDATTGVPSDPEPAVVSWSPDGEWLIGKAFYYDLRLTLIRFATGEKLPLNGSTVPFSMPAWKP
jgi:Tol biopolymer transport system component